VLQAILLFLLTSFISALGSLQLGPVNASVLRLSLNRDYKSARFLALGGSLPEILYAGIAIWGSGFLARWANLQHWLDLALVPIFFFIGMKLILAKKKSIQKEDNPLNPSLPFIKGLSLGLLNPQLPLFWLSILLWYKMNLGLEVVSPLSQVGFLLGTGAGAFALLIALIELCRKYQNKVLEFSIKHPPEIWIGSFFVGLAILQVIKLILNWKL